MDARIPVIIGVVFSVLSLYWLSFLNLHTSSAEAVGMLVMRGLGLGFIFPPIMNLALKSLPEDKVATGSSLINVSRQVGGALGVALLGAMLDRRQLHHETVLAQTQTVAANSAACLPQQMQTWLSQMSGIDDPAHLNALTTVQEFLKQKALVASFDDCFMISASIFALAFIPAILMRKRHA
jgi:DHA2 family multidrug resistance protein